MSVRCLPLLATALLGASFAGAQTYTGEGPPLFQPFAEFPAFRPANFGGLLLIEGIAARSEGGTYYLIVAGRLSRTGQPRLSAWRWNPATGTLTRLTDVDTFTLDGDAQVSLSHDLLEIIVFRNGAGVEAGSRAAANQPFAARRAVTGLLPNSYAVTLGQVDEGLLPTKVVFAATPAPNSEINRYSYDPVTARAAGRLVIGPREPSSNRYEFMAPVDDENGNTKSLLLARGQNLSDLQQFGYVAGVDGRAPVKWSWDTPPRNKCTYAVHWGGGKFKAPIVGHPLGQFPQDTMVDIRTTMTCKEKLASGGGRARFRMWTQGNPGGTPVPTLGTILLGAPGTQAIPLPGIGNLGLNPSLLIPLPVLDTSSGETAWDVNHPPLGPGVFFWIQGVDVGERITLSNTAEASQ